MYQHVSMMAIDLSGAACAARRRAVFHAMGVQTMRHRLAFPPVLTRHKRRAMARQGTCVTCCDHCDLRHTASHGARQARDNTLDPPWRGLAEPAQQALQVARRAKAFIMPLPPATGGRGATGASPLSHASGRNGVPGAAGAVD